MTLLEQNQDDKCTIEGYTQEEVDYLKKHWCSLHNHTGISNASRAFIDSSIKIENLVKYAMDKQLNGIAITDHESVGGFIQAEQLEESNNFPILRGNEIYLVSDKQYRTLKDEYESGMYFPHFLLIALDKKGNEQLRKLSTIAWVDNSFWNGGLLRTPTKMSDLRMVIGEDKGHLVASTACLGGQLSKWIIDKIENPQLKEQRDMFIDYFIKWCLEMFGKDNFFLEMQPSDKYRYSTLEDDKRIEYDELIEILKENPNFKYKKELEMQYLVNQYLITLSKIYNLPMIITTDAHYLKKEHLPLHSAFLNSSGGNDEDYSRNVEEIYRTAYLMSLEEILEYFKDYDKDIVTQAIINTGSIVERAKNYSLAQTQKVPKIEKPINWDIAKYAGFFPNKGIFKDILENGHEDDKYLLYRIARGMQQKPDVMNNLERSFIRLEEEIIEILEVSKRLEEHLGNYFITMEKLIDIIWKEGDSIVGAGRGSCASSLIAYCLDITQCNPLLAPVEMPFWRFITRERVELPDIDIDTQSNRRTKIFNAVKRYFTKRGGDTVNCGTYGTVGSKSAIQIACRGLGYSSDIGMEISSFIPVERGEVWCLNDVYYGNKEKGRKPIKEFVNLVDSYEGVMDIAFLIEGVINARGVHASGVFITNDDFCNYSAKMLSPKGIITSQWDLHESEYAGLVI